MTTTIAFLSLFFGLIVGRYPVELTVSGPVSAVELLVDGQSVQKLQAPPWKATIDFGKDLQPHEIVARALDAKGNEIARVQEWANLPHPLAKLEIVLEREKPGAPKGARIVWTDLKGEEPAARLLLFDGVPVKLDAAGRAVLPPHDLKSIHVLTAEVDFPSGRGARQEIAYGGEYGTEVSTELTAVPVRARQGKLPPAAQLGDWLTSGGRPLSVAAVEEGPAQLYVVRSPGVPTEIWRLANPRQDPKQEESDRRKNEKALQATEDAWLGLTLGRKDAVRLVFPFSERFEGSGEEESLTDLFTISKDLNPQDRSFPLLLVTARGPAPAQGVRLRFADAVAVAALEATTENRRRAVLLVLSPQMKDQSRYNPEAVRRYLATLRVPLVVWCVGEPEPGSAAASWGGKVEILREKSDVNRAFAALRKILDAQRIVMVDGRHLPQSIALSPKAAGVELVGVDP